MNYYSVDTLTYSDYYPFGMLMPNRYGSDVTPYEDYEFGAFGYEKDNEVNGNNNSCNTEFRQYDPRIARWTSPDKYEAKYRSISPYVFSINNPLGVKDLQGDSIEIIIGRPYTKNWTEHPYGHAALIVFDASKGIDKVYDFGRYGKTWGIGKGDGILNVYDNSSKYLASEQKDRTSVGYTIATTATQDQEVINHFDAEIKKGEIYKSGVVPGGGGTAYKLGANYDVFNNNCLTQCGEGLNSGEILNMIVDEYKPNNAFQTYESIFESFNFTRTEYRKGEEKEVTFKMKKTETVKPIIPTKQNFTIIPEKTDETGAGYTKPKSSVSSSKTAIK